jgi:spore coat protein U-like protein
MRHGLAAWAALCTVLSATNPAAAAAPRGVSTCSSSVVFGAPEWRAGTLLFRVTVDISCPLGVAFSAALSSPGGCELRSSTGNVLRYELFSDEALRSAVVSCERATQALTGTGRRSFVIYGRVDGAPGAPGRFHDALVTTIAP